jgi:hypothetical protein
MYKKLCIAILLIVSNQFFMGSSYPQYPNPSSRRASYNTVSTNTYRDSLGQNSQINRQPVKQILDAQTQTDNSQDIADLRQMQNDYASQQNNTDKAVYITTVLNDESDRLLTIQDKINRAKNLLKILAAEKTWYRSWWPTEEEIAQKKWLEEQRIGIQEKLSRLQSQASMFGLPTLYQTVQWTSIWLGTAFLIYVALNATNDYYNKKDPQHPNQYKYDYVDIATLPVSQFYALAKWAAIQGTTSLTAPAKPQAENPVLAMSANVAANIAAASAKVLAGAKDTIQKDVHAAGKYVAQITAPAKPLTPEQLIAQKKSEFDKEQKEAARHKEQADLKAREYQAIVKAAQEEQRKKQQAAELAQQQKLAQQQAEEPSLFEQIAMSYQMRQTEKAQEKARKEAERIYRETQRIEFEHAEKLNKIQAEHKNVVNNINLALVKKNIPTLDEQAAMRKAQEEYQRKMLAQHKRS